MRQLGAVAHLSLSLSSSWEPRAECADRPAVGGEALRWRGCLARASGGDPARTAASLSVAPDTTAGDTPAGLTTEIKVPQEGLSTPAGGRQAEAPIYITGPYEGAPYGLAIAVPVIAGPFKHKKAVKRKAGKHRARGKKRR